MSIEIKGSENYAAQIVRVGEVFKLPNSDRLYGVNFFGNLAVVDDSWVAREGELAVLFVTESQISEGFAWHANLHRHSDLNQNPTETGYLEDNRRVRALKLRGNVSKALLLPVAVIEKYTDYPSFQEGDRFDTVNGLEICRKYVIKEPQVFDRQGKKIKQAFKRVDVTLLPEHIETDQWLRNEQIVGADDILIVTQKLHGTSARFANTIVRRQLSWWERALVKLGVKISDTEYDTVAGSRRSIKDPHNPAQKHFYGEGGDVWTDYLGKIEQSIPKGYVVYGEIVGWVGESPIQKGHTYGVPQGENVLYVYRVATVNPDGEINDLSWDQVRQFCQARGLKTVPELQRVFKRDFELDALIEKDFHKVWKAGNAAGVAVFPDEPVPLSPGGTGKDEGVAIRVEGGAIPMLFKYKNDSHYLYETAQLDSGEVDLESAES